jgi:hypothetical protein
MGIETHNYKIKDGRPMIGGTCPWCGAYVTNIMHPKDVRVHPHMIPILDKDGQWVPVTQLPYGGEEHA